MNSTILGLIQNISLLVTLVVGLQMLARRLKQRSMLYRLASGVLFGAVGIAGMMMPMHFAPGVFYDGRSIILSLAGLFGGPVAAALATLLCGVYRVHLGGAGMLPGVGTIVEAAAIGVVLHYLRRRDRRWVGSLRLWLAGIVIHVFMLLLQLLLPAGRGWDVLYQIGPAVLIFYPLGFLLIAQVFLEAERKRIAEESLRENEERFRSLVEGAPDAIFVQTNGKFAYVNAAALRLFGASKQSELLGQPVMDRVHPSVRGAVWQQIESLSIHRRRTESLEGVCLRLDGGEVPVELSAVPTVYEASDGAIVFGRDISARKDLAAQLVQAQRMEAIGRLAGGVAHDFNNMLQTILGYSDMLLAETDVTHPSHDYLEQIQKAALRSANLTRQLLAFARKQTVAPRVLDLNEAIADMLKMLQRLIGEDIDLRWRPGDDTWPINMDPAQVDQVLANLVVNSRDAIAGTGTITIETFGAVFSEEYCGCHEGVIPGQYSMLAVSDDGVGMDNETLSRVFEPFFTTKSRDSGTGLGLATVYGIVKQNNGFIDIYSEKGHGTTVRVYLPGNQKGPTTTEKVSHRAESIRGTETVLLVEDEPAILRLSKHLLEQLGYTVLTATGPNQAMEMALEYDGHIDLLMTDVVMPQMNGRDLWAKLAKDFPSLRCLFMSGYTANVIADHGVLDAGVHFLQKPFSLDALAAKLREALENG